MSAWVALPIIPVPINPSPERDFRASCSQKPPTAPRPSKAPPAATRPIATRRVIVLMDASRAQSGTTLVLPRHRAPVNRSGQVSGNGRRRDPKALFDRNPENFIGESENSVGSEDN